MKVLLIEDDSRTSAFVKRGMEEHSHVIDLAANGREGLFLAVGESYDVVIVDSMLPGLDGLGVVKTMRGAGVTTPVLLLTTMGGIDDRVQGLEAGRLSRQAVCFRRTRGAHQCPGTAPAVGAGADRAQGRRS